MSVALERTLRESFFAGLWVQRRASASIFLIIENITLFLEPKQPDLGLLVRGAIRRPSLQFPCENRIVPRAGVGPSPALARFGVSGLAEIVDAEIKP